VGGGAMVGTAVGGEVLTVGAATPVAVPLAAAGVAVAAVGVKTDSDAQQTMNHAMVAKGNESSQAAAGKPSSAGQMQKEVERDQAPRDVSRVDKPHVPGQEAHVHFCDGTSCNQSGTTHDAHKGTPNPSAAARKWLEGHGWTPPAKGK
jgi:hypothetical protein